MDDVDSSTRNLIGPPLGSKDVTNDDYLLAKIEEENVTQVQLR